MDKKELYQYVGSMQQMVYIRKVTCEEGRSTGLRMFDVKNECLQYQVMCDKCLDLLPAPKSFYPLSSSYHG